MSKSKAPALKDQWPTCIKTDKYPAFLKKAREAWLTAHPGIRLPGGRPSLEKLIGEQCKTIRNGDSFRRQMSRGKFIKLVKERLRDIGEYPHDDTITKHVYQWMIHCLTLDEIPAYYRKQPEIQYMLSLKQLCDTNAPAIKRWLETIPPGTKLKDLKKFLPSPSK